MRILITIGLTVACAGSVVAQDTSRVGRGRDSVRAQFVSPVVVTSDAANGPLSAALPEFEARRAKGVGRFIVAADLRKEEGRNFIDVLRSRVPGLLFEVATDGTHGYNPSQQPPGAMHGNAGKKCYVQLVIDGNPVYQMDPGDAAKIPPPDLSELQARSLDGVEYYSNSSRTPAEFRGPGSMCGTLVVWSRRK